MSLWYISSASFDILTAGRTGNCVAAEQSVEHLEKEHSDEKENAHLDVMLIRTMLDARLTIN